MQNDQELRQTIEKAKKHDLEALSRIYEEFFDKIYRYILIRVRNKEAAEDLAGQTFLRMLERISDFDWKGAGFRSWLFRIAHNLVIDLFRKRQTISFDETVSKTGRSAENLAIVNETLSEVLESLTLLNENQRQVVLLRLVGGLSCRETAETLALSETNVRALQHRALARVRKKLKVKTDV
ncbi:MAG TPA: sigma-70 family RNA polymerase sigma factor [Actinobacteria bacterium]|nr:sigma-70 family RNA polymerase sigma factor [Actinomycetota bacterium]